MTDAIRRIILAFNLVLNCAKFMGVVLVGGATDFTRIICNVHHIHTHTHTGWVIQFSPDPIRSCRTCVRVNKVLWNSNKGSCAESVSVRAARSRAMRRIKYTNNSTRTKMKRKRDRAEENAVEGKSLMGRIVGPVCWRRIHSIWWRQLVFNGHRGNAADNRRNSICCQERRSPTECHSLSSSDQLIHF